MEKLKLVTKVACYQTAFDPNVYLNTYYKTYKGNEVEDSSLDFHLIAAHKFWSNFQAGSRRDDGEIRCLEYGGGPVISTLISASAKIDRIVFAEYTEANRNSVKSWIAGRQEAHNWTPLLEFVVRDLEGNGVPEAVLNREADIRRKIKSIVPCDVTKTPIVDLESVDIGKPFDVVSTSCCLEVCVTSEEQYKSAFGKLCELVKPDGYLCMYGVLGQTFYVVGEEKFSSFPLTREIVEAAMKDEGMEVEEIKILEKQFNTFSDASGMFFAVAKKTLLPKSVWGET